MAPSIYGLRMGGAERIVHRQKLSESAYPLLYLFAKKRDLELKKRSFRGENGGKKKNIEEKRKISCKIFCSYHKKQYLCSAFQNDEGFRAFSSAGSEHLPYKQRVGGSNPSTPTK